MNEEIEILNERINDKNETINDLYDRLDELSIKKNIGDFKTYEVTKYTAGPESTGKTPDDPLYGITASGVPVREGHVAMDDAVPFGSKVYIPYFDEVFTVKDRGGAINEGDIDVYTPDVEDALNFGRRELEAKIIKWGDG